MKPACLPDKSFNVEDGAICAIAGWGDANDSSKRLKQATIPKFNWDKCQALLTDINDGYPPLVDK